jgi:tetratricopeptide (TPR) repeat protein
MKKALSITVMLFIAFNSFAQIESKGKVEIYPLNLASADSLAGLQIENLVLSEILGLNDEELEKLENPVLREGISLFGRAFFYDDTLYPEVIKNFTELINNKELSQNKLALRVGHILRGLSKNQLKDYRGAILDFNKVIALTNEKAVGANLVGGLKMLAATYSYRGQSKRNLNHSFKEVMLDHNKSIRLNPNDGLNYFRSAISRQKFNQLEDACLDFSIAGELGVIEAYEVIKFYCD